MSADHDDVDLWLDDDAEPGDGELWDLVDLPDPDDDVDLRPDDPDGLDGVDGVDGLDDLTADDALISFEERLADERSHRSALRIPDRSTV